MTETPDRPAPTRGSIVTYVPQPGHTGHGPFAWAVAIGPAVVDPGTNLGWIPIRRPDRGAILLDPLRVVDVVPPVPGPGSDQ